MPEMKTWKQLSDATWNFDPTISEWKKASWVWRACTWRGNSFGWFSVSVHLLQASLLCFVLIEDLVVGEVGNHLLQEPEINWIMDSYLAWWSLFNVIWMSVINIYSTVTSVITWPSSPRPPSTRSSWETEGGGGNRLPLAWPWHPFQLKRGFSTDNKRLKIRQEGI